MPLFVEVAVPVRVRMKVPVPKVNGELMLRAPLMVSVPPASSTVPVIVVEPGQPATEEPGVSKFVGMPKRVTVIRPEWYPTL